MRSMTRASLLAGLLAAGLATPAIAGDPLAPLAPVQRREADMRALRQNFPGARGELASRLLPAHNRDRAAGGPPPLVWDPDLAASAASYGPTLLRLGQLIHSPRETRP